jgi:hypothetical protein
MWQIGTMRRCIGRLQKMVRRELIIRAGKPATTVDFMKRAFPRLDHYARWNYRAVRRAALRFAIPVGRSSCGKGRAVVWVPTPELLKLIRPRHSDSD